MGQRASWKYILFSILVCLQVCVHLYFSFRGEHARAGFIVSDRIADGIRVHEVMPGYPAERAGLLKDDIILEVAGHAVHSGADYDSIKLRYLASGTASRFVVLRDTRKVELTLTPTEEFEPLKFLIGVLLVLLCLVLGIFCYMKNPADARTRLLLLIFLSFAVVDSWLTSAWFGSWTLDRILQTSYEMLDGLNYGLLTLMPFFIPRKKQFLEKRPWMVPVMLAPGIVYGFLTISNSFLASRKPGSFLVPDEFLVGVSEYYLRAIFLSIPLVVFHSLKTAESSIERSQAKTMLLGVTLWALSNSAVFALQEIYPDSWIADSYYAAIVDIIIPISVFFAIYRHRLFDIDVLIRKGLIYTLVSGALFAIYFLAIGLLGWLVAVFFSTEQSVGMMTNSLSTLAVGLAFIPVRRYSQRLIDRLFYRQKYDYLNVINTIFDEMPTAFNLETLVETLSTRIFHAMRIKNLSVMIPDEEHSRFFLRTKIGNFSASDLENRVVLLGSDVLIRTLIESGGPLYGKDLKHLSLSERERQTLSLLQTRMVLPVLHQKRPVAVLLLGEKQSETWYDAEDITFLTTIARQAAMLMENARLLELATYDGLTQLMRRSAFDSLFEAEIQRSRRYQRSLSLIMMDIDYFKALNDCHGHQVGDLVIKRIAGALKSNIRKSDTASRYGGEEFAILLPETGPGQAVVVAENLRSIVESLQVPIAGGDPVRITASFGVCSLQGEEITSADDLYRHADTALYRAKSAGRNRVVAARGSELPSPPAVL